MLWVWVVIVGSIALAAYLWMRIDEARRPEPRAPNGAPNGAVLRKAKQ